MIELFASPEVGTYLGGARPREELEGAGPVVPGLGPGFFGGDRAAAMSAPATRARRAPGPPGRARADGAGIELGYLFLPHAWGYGYATEACTAALDWCARALPGEPVMLSTQIGNDRSMRLAARLGFAEVERFEEYGAEQWLGVWTGGPAPATAGVDP